MAKVKKRAEGIWLVESKSSPDVKHTVELQYDGCGEVPDVYKCDCTAGRYGKACSHIKSVEEQLEIERLIGTGSLWGDVLARVEPLATQALFARQCSLVEFDGLTARVAVKVELLYEVVKERRENLETAFALVSGSRVNVGFELDEAIVEAQAKEAAAIADEQLADAEDEAARAAGAAPTYHPVGYPTATAAIADEPFGGGEEVSQALRDFVPSADQARALEELHNFSRSGNYIHTLTGYAGTGKTLLLQAFVSQLRAKEDNRRIVFTAFTNQATQVLRGMVGRWGLSIECITCSKLLGLRPVVNQTTGQQEFRQITGEVSMMQDYDLVVVDEASMIPSDLYDIFLDNANLLTRLLFVGDPAQLPPVGEACSRVFLGGLDSMSSLTEVLRYGGAIAELADRIRRNLATPAIPEIKTNTDSDGKGVYLLTQESWAQNLVRAFKSDQYQVNPNYVRALAYTNRTVDATNAMVREEIIGKDAPRFTVGERLIADEPYGISKGDGGFTILLQTSTQVEILGAYEGTVQGWGVWYLDVLTLDSDVREVTVPVLHERDARRFERERKKLVKEKSWKKFYEMSQSFAWFKYSYSTTIHKAQGSTFNHVFMERPDILSNNSRAQIRWPDGRKETIFSRNQLLYVSATRPSDRLICY